jgi:hypothetical protein
MTLQGSLLLWLCASLTAATAQQPSASPPPATEQGPGGAITWDGPLHPYVLPERISLRDLSAVDLDFALPECNSDDGPPFIAVQGGVAVGAGIAVHPSMGEESAKPPDPSPPAP